MQQANCALHPPGASDATSAGVTACAVMAAAGAITLSSSSTKRMESALLADGISSATFSRGRTAPMMACSFPEKFAVKWSEGPWLAVLRPPALAHLGRAWTRMPSTHNLLPLAAPPPVDGAPPPLLPPPLLPPSPPLLPPSPPLLPPALSPFPPLPFPLSAPPSDRALPRAPQNAAAQRAVGLEHVSERLACERAALISAAEHALDGLTLVRVPVRRHHRVLHHNLEPALPGR